MSETPPQQSAGELRRALGPAVDHLSFLDLLYAVPVGDLAMRVSNADLARVPSADWSALAVILATIVLSWVGLHKNRAAMADEDNPRQPIGLIPFWNLLFVQFLIEVIIIGMYFAMGLFLKLPTASDSAGLPAEGWLTGLLFLIFVLYLAWDLIDTHLAKNPIWHETAWNGALVTMKFLAAAGIIFLVVAAVNPRAAVVVILVNSVLVILLYAYRVAQDRCGNTP
jgi:quinol-cytochrome oxidoreductase complex cytochrome b subunit